MPNHTEELVNSILQPPLSETQSQDSSAQALLDDIETLRKEFPDLPLSELASDPLFIRFARGKGNDFRAIYEDFGGFLDSVRETILNEEREKRKQLCRSGGSSKSTPATYGLSRSQLDFLDAWNRDNPNYAMTPKQYAQHLKNS